MNILADASLPLLKEAFPAPFNLSYYQHPHEIPSLLNQQEILICRSTLRIDKKLLNKHCLRFIATASSGSDHIDKHLLHNEQIELIDAKGSNASAVADYILCCMAYLQQTGRIAGRKIAVIGCGAVGSKVSLRLQTLGFEIFIYDPLKPHFTSCTLMDLISCDVVCLHPHLHHDAPYPSYHLLNDAFLQQLKPGAVIINAARGGVVDEHALIKYLPTLYYCTDVYSNEPHINPEIVKLASLCTPHIAGHSLEAKTQAIEIISEKLHKAYEVAFKSLPPIHCQLPAARPQESSWADVCLSLYNPVHETRLLKKATVLAETFVSLRKAHNIRHDFNCYADHLEDPFIRHLYAL